MADNKQKVAIYVDEENEVWQLFSYFVLGYIESVVGFWFVLGWISMAWSSWTIGTWNASVHILQIWPYHIDVLKAPGELVYEPILPEEAHDELIDTILETPFKVLSTVL